jgi:hypothetical protein
VLQIQSMLRLGLLLALFCGVISGDRGSTGGDRRLVIYQGAYQSLGATPEAVADALGQAATFVLSHVETVDFGNGCLDVAYPGGMGRLIAAIRKRNPPPAAIYGYVAGTADAPSGTACGQAPAAANWSCPPSGCPHFGDWVGRWQRLGDDRPDGIFVDTVGPGWMSPSVRDSLASTVTSHGFRLMVNTPVVLENVQFATAAAAMANQALLVEGWCIAEQTDRLAACEAISAFLVTLTRNITRHALVTEAWGANVSNCNSLNARAASKPFWAAAGPRDCWQYSGADLGIVTGKGGVNTCAPPPPPPGPPDVLMSGTNL